VDQAAAIKARFFSGVSVSAQAFSPNTLLRTYLCWRPGSFILGR
jgi:hypothetical protein